MYRGVSPTSQIRAEVRMKSGNSIWAKYREAGEVIDLQGLFSDYWSSKKHEYTVLSQSLPPTDPCRSDCEAEAVAIGKYNGSLEVRLFADDTVRTFATTRPRQLIRVAGSPSLVAP